MSHRVVRAALGAVLAAGLVASPASATSSSSRVDSKLRAAERALDRAGERAEDGSSAAASLASVRRNVASAQKTAVRKGDERSLAAVARAQGRVVSSTVSLFDGLTGENVAAVALTLDAALDGRDAVVAASAGKTGVLALINRDAAGDAEDIADTLADDELTDEARAALTAAASQVAATVTATGGSTSTSTDPVAADGTATGDEDCPPGGEGEGARFRGGDGGPAEVRFRGDRSQV